MPFADLIGNETSLRGVRSALARNRLHHAYLFTGPDGVGKHRAALALAMALHCAEKSEDSCGSCLECLRIRDRNHPDVRELEPLPGKKEITIQQVRDLEKDLRFRSFGGGRKVAIIDPAALLNQFSQNALLKTLEEPPPHSVLILIAANAGALLPTIRSRCLRVNFGPIPRRALVEFLITKGQNRTDAEALAALSMGSVGDALALTQGGLRDQRRRWGEGFAALRCGDHRGALEMAEALASSREESLDFLRWAQTWYRDLLIERFALEDVVNLDLLNELKSKAREGFLGRLLACAGETEQAVAEIRRNLNRRMVLEQHLLGAIGSIDG
jgi:DNA polymerase-3 subunit delta'